MHSILRLTRARTWSATISLALLAGCSGTIRDFEPAPASPAEIRAHVARLLPPGTKDRDGWATDVQVAFTSLELTPSVSNLCAALAVAEQESGITADPPVAGLPKIAWSEIERRADKLGIPMLAVRIALKLPSPNGDSYGERLDTVRTERELSLIFEDFISMVPLGKRLFGDLNPVRTAGAMQVSVAFAEQHAKRRTYPYLVPDSIRREVFTRHGGMYFGIAHLLDYSASYDSPLYRFADFNAGRYASRNAAFQKAVSAASGIKLALDGDLIIHGKAASDPGATERAVRTLGKSIDMDERAIRRALEEGDTEGFEDTRLYKRVFELAEQREGRPLARAVLPQIALAGPKISRKLTTGWFAKRVETRYRRCLARGGESADA
ncbi:MAG: DUF1615 domain-containing protein [Betaproteobacteria bacterium HGW-Betaproteobacteria-13]|jgi:hypothetical protein|nr:MAG: DUF1615 domain-containing protein [Betaproteobacteria bacterium HGW-Betaproteobacteria-19]PKO79344.1 MAG: DUF1615 domain-containing protein [Betaproteobacteria bacterium HGW-Betaproteobacteria-13]